MGAEMTEDELRKQFEKEFDQEINNLLGIGKLFVHLRRNEAMN